MGIFTVQDCERAEVNFDILWEPVKAILTGIL